MKMRFVTTVLLFALFASGCVTESYLKSNNEKIKIYTADLTGDGSKKIIETEDKTATDSTSLVTVKAKTKNKDKNKMLETIDSISLPGKIRKVEFAEINFDGQEQMVIYFDGKDNLSNIAIYQLKDNKLYKIFSADSAYGIDARFDSVAKIRVGKAAKGHNVSNFLPDWDTWVWTGDKFIKE